MGSDLVKLFGDFGSLFGFISWSFYQWYMAGFFLFMIGEYGWAVFENKYPAVRSSHIIFLLIMLVSVTVLGISGFFK